MGKRGISIIDIARMAGVSKATVSNVLNGRGRVGEETRALVLEIAEREGYVANFAAKSLRASETKTVGILTPDVSNDFFSAIVMRIERELYSAGYTSFVCDTESDPQRESSYLRSLQQKQVDGLIFVSSTRSLDLSCLPQAIPSVIVDRSFEGTGSRFVQVVNDTRAITHDITQTLLGHGCQRIAFVTSSASKLLIDRHERYLGYMEALAESGVRLDHKLVLRGMHERPSHFEAYEMVGGLLSDQIPFDGIVATGDRAAIGAIEALAAHGLQAGKDVLVIGCDNIPIGSVASLSLSSVNRHVDELAAAASSALVDMMGGNEPSAQQIVVPHEVIERATTLGMHAAGTPHWY